MPSQNMAHRPPSIAVTARFGKIATYRKKPPRLPTSATERRINTTRSIMPNTVQFDAQRVCAGSNVWPSRCSILREGRGDALKNLFLIAPMAMLLGGLAASGQEKSADVLLA